MPSILITGGSGALGQALVSNLLFSEYSRISKYSRICVLSRGEYKQFEMSQRFDELDKDKRIRYFIGDVRDKDRLVTAFRGVDTVVHAAALKRIEVGNYNPIEMVKTNVLGTINVIEAAQATQVKKVLFINSDKSYAPISPYGSSKSLAGAMVLAANNTTGWTGPRFSQCLYGNVARSTGSVIPRWEELIAKGATEVPVTDPECTRFFMTMGQAVKLVTDTLDIMKGGETNIPELPAHTVGDLAKAMGVGMKITGLPAWEKRHETMAPGMTSENARRMSVEELKKELGYS